DPTLLRPGGTKATVSVLFADLCGFTRFSERIDPTEVMKTLNETFAQLTKIVEEHGGTFDKYVGDCLMAFYGAPVSSEDHAFRAVHSAYEMQQAFETLKKERWTSAPQDALSLAIGINSGEVIVGNVGSDKQMTYTVIGDVVNVAARLQSAAGAGQIFVSD